MQVIRPGIEIPAFEILDGRLRAGRIAANFVAAKGNRRKNVYRKS
jgi:hypothetical protein